MESLLHRWLFHPGPHLYAARTNEILAPFRGPSSGGAPSRLLEPLCGRMSPLHLRVVTLLLRRGDHVYVGFCLLD